MRFKFLLTFCCIACFAFSQNQDSICLEKTLRAVWEKDTIALGKLFENSCDPNAVHHQKGGRPFNLISLAALTKRPEIFKFLLEHGADPNLIPGPRCLPLPIFSAVYPNGEPLLELLISHKADLNLIIDGECPLNNAIEVNNLNAVKTLLANGAMVNFPSYPPLNHPPLGVAAFRKRVEMVNLLLDAGAKTEFELGKKDKGMFSVLFYIVENTSLEIAKILVQRGAVVNVMAERVIEHGRNTPIDCAARVKNYNLIKFLHENGARLYDENRAAIYIPAKYCDVETVSFLAKLGIDQNWATKALWASMTVSDVGFKNPLPIEQRIKTAEILLDAGADLHLPIPEYPYSQKMVSIASQIPPDRVFYAELFVEKGKAKWEEIQIKLLRTGEFGLDATVFAPNGLRLRTHPSLKAPIVVVIPGKSVIQIASGEYGEEIVVDGYRGKWKYAHWNGKTGFVFSGYLN